MVFLMWSTRFIVKKIFTDGKAYYIVLSNGWWTNLHVGT